MNSCGGAQLSGAILIGSTPKLNGKSSAKATKRIFTFVTQNGERMPKYSLRPRCTGCFSCLASRNLSRRVRAVHILTTCRWVYNVFLNRKDQSFVYCKLNVTARRLALALYFVSFSLMRLAPYIVIWRTRSDSNPISSCLPMDIKWHIANCRIRQESESAYVSSQSSAAPDRQ